jgi:hypothetical protein
MYLEMTKEDFEQMKEMMPDYQEDEEGSGGETTVSALGESKEINGMRCEAYEIKSGEDVTIAWVTEDLRDVVDVFLELESRLKSMGMFDEEDEDTETFLLLAEHGFPVLEQALTMYYGEPDSYEISEVLSIDRGELSGDLFKIPSEYERHSIMDMMRMFGGQN